MGVAIEQADESVDRSGMGGHPAGLTTLFFTELWERFSYYGMRAILVLYMVTSPALGGLGYGTKEAASLYGTYTMAVYFMSLPGGFIADRWLGARLSVLLGGIIIACGHYSLIFASMPFFYTGLVLISVGTGLLKPNISALVGNLYAKSDLRRDSGFSLFYMGINIGAMAAPLVCGFLAQSPAFKAFLVSRGMSAESSWHWGFAAAGVGMTLGLVIFLLRKATLKDAGERIVQKKTESPASAKLTSGEWRRMAVIFILFFFTILFWGAYEQKGASLNLFARDLVRTEIGGHSFPSSWLQSLTAFFIILLAPLFSRLWIRMGDRQPSSPAKFAFGLLFIGLGYALLAPACALTASGKISPLWLAGLYFLEVVGEMCLSPVGLSTVTKLAPARLLGIMMGVWFLAASIGSKLAGYLSGFYVSNEPSALVRLYGGIAAGLLVACGLLAALTPRIRRMIGNIG